MHWGFVVAGVILSGLWVWWADRMDEKVEALTKRLDDLQPLVDEHALNTRLARMTQAERDAWGQKVVDAIKKQAAPRA